MCLNILEHFQATLQRDFGEIRDRDQADVVEGEVGGEQLIVTDINMDFNAQLSPEVSNTGKTLVFWWMISDVRKYKTNKSEWWAHTKLGVQRTFGQQPIFFFVLGLYSL